MVKWKMVVTDYRVRLPKREYKHLTQSLSNPKKILYRVKRTVVKILNPLQEWD